MGHGTIATIVRVQRDTRADDIAVVYGDRTVTWRELDESSSRLANALTAAGVGPQDRVARIEKNAPDYFELLFAAAKINAVLVDVNWRLAAPEMRQIVDDSGAIVLFVGDEFAAHLEKFEAELASVRTVVSLGAGDTTHPSVEQWTGNHPGTDPGTVSGPDDICLQLYTSGTTGLPKGVMLSNRNLFAFIDEVPAQWGLTQAAVVHVVMPTFHIAGSGMGVLSLAMGARMVLDREVDPTRIAREVEAHQVTHAIYVPAVLAALQMVAGAGAHDLSSMQLIAYGASPISDRVLRGAIAQFPTAAFVQVYGLTETTGAVVQLDPADHDPENRPELLRAAGRPYPWIELRVVGPDGEDARTGEVGEIWIRGVQVMAGYWNNPAETAHAITPDGWLRSGDAGYVVDGYLYLHDRVKDMIVTGGENVYPTEVENAIMGCPGVADVAAIGVPDESGARPSRPSSSPSQASRSPPSMWSPGPASASPASKCPRVSISSTPSLAIPRARS